MRPRVSPRLTLAATAWVAVAVSGAPAPPAAPLRPLSYDTSAALRELCVLGQLPQALLLLESAGEPPDEDSYVALFHLQEWCCATEAGMRACQHNDSAHPSFGLHLGNAMLSMLVSFGEPWHAWRVFAKMPERDVFSWDIMVGGYGKVGFLEQVLELISSTLTFLSSCVGHFFRKIYQVQCSDRFDQARISCYVYSGDQEGSGRTILEIIHFLKGIPALPELTLAASASDAAASWMCMWVADVVVPVRLRWGCRGLPHLEEGAVGMGRLGYETELRQLHRHFNVVTAAPNRRFWLPAWPLLTLGASASDTATASYASGSAQAWIGYPERQIIRSKGIPAGFLSSTQTVHDKRKNSLIIAPEGQFDRLLCDRRTSREARSTRRTPSRSSTRSSQRARWNCSRCASTWRSSHCLMLKPGSRGM